MKLIERLEKWNKFLWVELGLGLIITIGLLDFATGFEYSFSLFYLLPIVVVVWFVNKKTGIVFSVLAAIVWFMADYLSGKEYSQPIIFFWNTGIRFGFFIIVTWLLAALKIVLEHQKSLSRIDRLTGAISSDYFYDLMQIEIDRFERYKRPFTLAYIDIDNFKNINDQFGHNVGDLLLRTVVTAIMNSLRKTDIVTRMGGDEFAILLLEASAADAQLVISRIQQRLAAEMGKNHWEVTFSIGVSTFNEVPKTTNEIIKSVDDLMYSVKRAGKDGVSYTVYTG